MLLAILSGCGDTAATAAPKIIKTKLGAEMVLIPAGSFRMGSTSKPDEGPVHTVKLDAFLMDRTEVTQEMYAKLQLPQGSHFEGGGLPAEQISWTMAAKFCNDRSKAEGLKPCYIENNDEVNTDFEADGYRLPTEAEWEYACRCGGAADGTSDGNKLSDYAWYADNSNNKTHPVGQKRANAWGLYDMQGNVAEWCQDVYEKNYYQNSPENNPRGPAKGLKYVLRGGSWALHADSLRPTARGAEDSGMSDACFAKDEIGFRCMRKAP